MSPSPTTVSVPDNGVHIRKVKTTTLTLTTPFVAPSSCVDAFSSTITATDTRHTSSTTTVWELQLSSEAGCRPSGADDPGEHSTAYSLAVCPSGWTAYSLGASSTAGMKSKNVLYTATCCSSGFNATSIDVAPTSGGLCGRPVPRNTSSSGGTTVTSVVRLHEPWLISWRAADASTLTPAPPALTPWCTGAQVDRWVPGTPASHQRCLGSQPEDTSGWSSAILFVEVGIPLIVVGITALCWGWCWADRWRERRRRRREKRGARGRDEVEMEAGAGRGTERPGAVHGEGCGSG